MSSSDRHCGSIPKRKIADEVQFDFSKLEMEYSKTIKTKVLYVHLFWLSFLGVFLIPPEFKPVWQAPVPSWCFLF